MEHGHRVNDASRQIYDAHSNEPRKLVDFSRNIGLSSLLLITDLTCLLFIWTLSCRVFPYTKLPYLADMTQPHMFLLCLCLLFWCAYQGHYVNRGSMSTEAADLVAGAAFVTIASGFNLLLCGTTLAVLISGRMTVKWLLFKLGYSKLPTVVIGSAAQCATLHQLLDRDWYRGLWIKYEIRCDDAEGAAVVAEVARRAEGGDVRHILVATNLAVSEMVPLHAIGRDHGLTFSIVPLSNTPGGRLVIDRYFGNDMVVLRGVSSWWPRRQVHFKRGLDVVLSLFIISLMAPAFGLIGCLVRLDGGPIFYASPRLGVGGRTFRALKFRTMVVNSDQVFRDLLARDPEARREWETTFKLRDDPRITRIGAFLRRYSLDELPQLINVLRGEMSLVGPRPLLPAERELYGDRFDLYCKCLPGITGPWQVSGRNDLAYHRRSELNTWYANNASVWIDIVILVRTVSVVLYRVGAV